VWGLHPLAGISTLRRYLRDCLRELQRDRKFKAFRDADSFEDTPDYLDVVAQPMHFDLMMERLNLGGVPSRWGSIMGRRTHARAQANI
jgi:hypothetical protein